MTAIRTGQALAPLTRSRLTAQKLWRDGAEPLCVLLSCGSARNDGTCHGEPSKT